MSDAIAITLKEIAPVPAAAMRDAQAHLDRLTKPVGSLGRLEELACRLAAIFSPDPPVLRKKTVFVFAADHGVAQEGVSAYPADVTPQMVLNFLNGGAAINVLAKHAGAEVVVVDMGVAHDFGPLPDLLDRKIAHGTRNMAVGPAMTREQAERAVCTGIELAREWTANGADLLAVGEMGIGNSTAASALLSVYGGRPVQEVTGTGTGIDADALKQKIAVIERAIALNQPDAEDPLDGLAKVGGFEIAAITGCVLGAAACRRPVVIDGLISSAGALLAHQLETAVADYIFCSHRSTEPGHAVFFERFGGAPLFDFSMRLGEGTGAALAISMLEAAVRLYSEMATFESAQVSPRVNGGAP